MVVIITATKTIRKIWIRNRVKRPIESAGGGRRNRRGEEKRCVKYIYIFNFVHEEFQPDAKVIIECRRKDERYTPQILPKKESPKNGHEVNESIERIGKENVKPETPVARAFQNLSWHALSKKCYHQAEVMAIFSSAFSC